LQHSTKSIVFIKTKIHKKRNCGSWKYHQFNIGKYWWFY